MKMNKNTIEQLAAFITEDPDKFEEGLVREEVDWRGTADEFKKKYHQAVDEPSGPGSDLLDVYAADDARDMLDDYISGKFQHSDIKIGYREREDQKRKLASLTNTGPKDQRAAAQKILAYIEAVEHMSRSGLEFSRDTQYDDSGRPQI